MHRADLAYAGGVYRLSGGREYRSFDATIVALHCDDGTVGWGESASSHIFLCYNKQGCEGRGRDGAHKAIAQMAMTRDKGHGAPHTLPGSQKVWQEGNDVSGDLNQGMWSGGDVYLFQKRAR